MTEDKNLATVRRAYEASNASVRWDLPELVDDCGTHCAMLDAADADSSVLKVIRPNRGRGESR